VNAKRSKGIEGTIAEGNADAGEKDRSERQGVGVIGTDAK